MSSGPVSRLKSCPRGENGRRHPNPVTDSATFTTTEASNEETGEDLGDLLLEVLPPDRSTMGNLSAREALARGIGRSLEEACRNRATGLRAIADQLWRDHGWTDQQLEEVLRLFTGIVGSVGEGQHAAQAALPRFRLHTFFKNPEGLFTTVVPPHPRRERARKEQPARLPESLASAQGFRAAARAHRPELLRAQGGDRCPGLRPQPQPLQGVGA